MAKTHQASWAYSATLIAPRTGTPCVTCAPTHTSMVKHPFTLPTGAAKSWALYPTPRSVPGAHAHATSLPINRSVLWHQLGLRSNAESAQDRHPVCDVRAHTYIHGQTPLHAPHWDSKELGTMPHTTLRPTRSCTRHILAHTQEHVVGQLGLRCNTESAQDRGPVCDVRAHTYIHG
jgi:hypothetical protein